MKKAILFSVVILLSIVCANAQKLTIAIFDPTSNGTAIDEGTKMAVREIISSTIVNMGEFDIVERSLLEQVMAEQKFSNSGIVDDSQAMEIGKLAGASKIVLSVITLTGGRNMLSIKMIDVKTAKVEKQKVKVVASGELLDVVEVLTAQLFDKEPISSTVSQTRPNTIVNNPPKPVVSTQASTVKNNFIVGSQRVKRPNGLNEGSVEELLKEKTIYVTCDFSSARVGGMTISEFGQLGKPEYDDKYNSFEESILAAERLMAKVFMEEANDKAKYFKYQTYQPNTKYTLTIHMVEIDEDGRDNVCDYVFSETATGRVVAVFTMDAHGGRFGDFNNLMGDAFKDYSGKFQKMVNSELKKCSKK